MNMCTAMLYVYFFSNDVILTLFQILEMTGYKIDSGADFKLFAVMAALSQRITALE